MMTSLKSKFLNLFLCASLLPVMIRISPGNNGSHATSIGQRPELSGFLAAEVRNDVTGSRPHGMYDIGPVLAWNTFLGGLAYDEGDDLITDGQGNIYVTGYTDVSWGSPIRGFSVIPDAFVAKLNPAGNLIWNTFLGGSGGDIGYGVALDASGNVYVTGQSTTTWGAPLRAYSAGSDGFLAKLDTNGNLIWNTFLGSTGTDQTREIAIRGGNVYVVGRSDLTWGNVVPRPYTGDMDAFAANIDTNGNLLWNSFLGGAAFDDGYGIAVDGSGAIYVTGLSSPIFNAVTSWGSPIRAYTAFRDAFLAKLASGGNLLWNSFLGGTGSDEGLGIAVDGSGNSYVTGYSTITWESPVRPFTSIEDAFAAKVNTNGVLAWNTFLGGSAPDQARAIDVDGNGNVYVTGYSTGSWGNPARAFSAGNDAFAAKLEPGGNLMWNTFLGGSGQDYGYGIEVDGRGSVYVTAPSNVSWGAPVRPYTADMDASVVKLDFPPLVVSTSLKSTMNPGPQSFTVTFSEDVNNPAGSSNTDDATNPGNYLLINKGANGIPDTTSCAAGLAGDDERITVTSVTYNATSFTSTVTLTAALPAGKYRLLVCGTTSIVDLAGNALAGNGILSGTDYTFDFTVNTPPVNVPGNVASLPGTGFAPHTDTSLPSQPADQTYSSLDDLWLEIPSQNLSTDIVGVPQSDLRWDVTWLGKDIGWLNGTAFPSWEGNSVLTGHVYNSNGLPGPFYNLRNLKYGDAIVIHLYGEKYIFQVQATRLLSPASTGFALEHLEDHSYLTLITCQGYNPLNNSYLFRRVVRAILVDVQPE
jgi:LPXTG-site transpeptidase (sortase) family protein